MRKPQALKLQSHHTINLAPTPADIQIQRECWISIVSRARGRLTIDCQALRLLRCILASSTCLRQMRHLPNQRFMIQRSLHDCMIASCLQHGGTHAKMLFEVVSISAQGHVRHCMLSYAGMQCALQGLLRSMLDSF